MDQQQAKELLNKYNQGKATPGEIKLLENWYAAESARQQANPQDEDYIQIQNEIWDRIQTQRGKEQSQQSSKTFRLWPRIAAAASIILAITAAGYFFIQKQHPANQQTASLIKNDIAPGHSQATLTLANGKKIVLTKGLHGLIAQQGKTNINATDNNITYTSSKQADQIRYNTLSTAKGEQSPYPLVLDDGTKIWLNAESSITFPTAFTGKERIVKVSGQARFEVAHNAAHPFKVQTAKQTIEDIGTVFDVNAYPDEPATVTTLVEGKVKVNGLVLSPGQQTDGTKIKTVNVRQYTAWSNNDFDFRDENIQSIMRQLTRWYKIEVSYEGNITTEGLNAQITRNRNISSVLKVLERTKGVHFKIEGRRVTVIE